MHIAIDAVLLKNQNAGTGFYTHHLLTALSKLTHPHRLTVFIDDAYQKSHEFESERMKVSKVKLHSVGHRILWEQLTLPYHIGAIKADVALYPFFIKPVLSKLPSIVIIHDALVKAFPESVEPSRRWYLGVIIERSIQQAAHIVTVSEYAKADIVKHYGVEARRISVVEAAPAPHFQLAVSEKERHEILQKYGVPFEQFFLSVGMFNKYKNYLELLQAFQNALQTNPALRLVMVGGDGNDSARLAAFVESKHLQDKVFRARYVTTEELRAFYSAATALVMTSQYESFGLPIVEAMQSGCPVVVASRTAMPETAGDAGLRYGTTEELTNILLELWRNEELRQQLKQKGLVHAKKFSWQNSAEKMLKVLEQSYESSCRRFNISS
jgi:glycosyltransferase involved in cell wall biosynthesis